MTLHEIQNHLCISSNSSLLKLLPLIEKLSQKNYSILITGESGTGKEILAQLIHKLSNSKSIQSINCGSLNQNLIGSELFGHQKGAFTGASSDNLGLIQNANNGTLFLDEIGELPLDLQTQFLRVLQELKVKPLGSNKEIKVQFRLISATHKNLRDAVKNDLFREDLLYRINTFEIELLPLRKRKEDIPLLANSIWKTLSSSSSQPLPELSLDELESLNTYHWPGNIRELKNTLEQFSVFRELGMTLYEVLDKNKLNSKLQSNSEEQIIRKTLVGCKNNKSLAARQLGISRGSLSYKLKKIDY
jgi:transcriptional regulator with PAS, ATPase and Fis domain